MHAQLWEAVAALDTTARLPAIACPTLILAGRTDPSCPQPAARLIHAQIGGSHLAVLPETSHMMILQRPDVISTLLTDFLARLPSAQ